MNTRLPPLPEPACWHTGEANRSPQVLITARTAGASHPRREMPADTDGRARTARLLVSRLASEAGTALTLSHLLRPYLDLLRHCEEQLAHEFHRAELIRPLNDKTHLALSSANWRR